MLLCYVIFGIISYATSNQHSACQGIVIKTSIANLMNEIHLLKSEPYCSIPTETLFLEDTSLSITSIPYHIRHTHICYVIITKSESNDLINDELYFHTDSTMIPRDTTTPVQASIKDSIVILLVITILLNVKCKRKILVFVFSVLSSITYAQTIGNLTCGETVNGYLSAGTKVTYSFILTPQTDVEFNGCASDFITVFTIYFPPFDVNTTIATDVEGCSDDNIFIPGSYIYLSYFSYYSGDRYYLDIEGVSPTFAGNYQVDYACYPSTLEPSSNPTAQTNHPSLRPTKNPASADISFQSSSIRLPQLLEHPIAVYNHDTMSLITIPSNTSNQIYVVSPFTEKDLENKNYISNFISIKTQPDFWPHSISCYNHYWGAFTPCHATRNQYLYIIQQREVDGSMLLVYNMADNTFMDQSSYRYSNSLLEIYFQNDYLLSKNRYEYSVGPNIICLYFQSETLMLMAGYFIQLDDTWPDLASFEEVYGVSYNVETDEWNIVGEWRYFSVIRSGTACVYSNDYAYIFGGTLQSGKQLSFGEKCIDIPGPIGVWPSSPDCEFFYENMQYPRSDFYISVILERYLLIYGGTTAEAMDNMEVFDMRTETFVTTLPNTLGSLDVQRFSSLVSSDVLMIIGGRYRDSNDALESIEYMDLSELFIDRSTIQYILPCFTTIISNDSDMCTISDNFQFCLDEIDEDGGGECTSMDDYQYLLDAQTELYFEIIDNDKDGFWFLFQTLFEQWISIMCRLESNVTLQCLNSNPTIHEFITLAPHLWTIEQTISNHYVLWMKWLPQLYLGFGEVLGLNNIDIDLQIDVIGIMHFKVCNGIFKFRSDSCTLDLDIVSEQQFIIGDYVHLISDWDLSSATSLDVPIYITSNDIKDFDHIMTITDDENDTSICTLCRISNDNQVINESCHECEEGIKITDLKTYDVNNNSYEITIASEFNGMDPQQTIIIAHRIVQDIQVDIFISINDSVGIYPSSELFLIPNYDKTNPCQPNGTFTIKFDESLSFENDGILWIDFYDDICTLTYDNNNSINCYHDSIIIPWTMTFKDITSNVYTLEVRSLDTRIIGQKSFEFWREIQEVSVDISNEIYLGQRIDVSLHISDENIVQKTSSIIISNTEHNIYSVIEITYNILNETATISCIIDSPKMDITSTCNEGIPFKTSTTDVVNDIIHLTISSPDTYIEPQQHSLFITECNIGSEFFGSTDTSYVCVSCGIGSVGLLQNSKCFNCEGIDGIDCAGSSQLIISYNYWIQINDEGGIISNFCPSGFCCLDVNGCNYTESKRSEFGICAYGRNSSVPLCGKCMEGYSQVFGSSHCKKCKKSNYSLVLIPMILAMLFVLILLIIDPPHKPALHEIDYAKKLLMDDIKAIQLCILRPMLYFFQSLNFVTIQNGLFFYLAPLTRILSLDLFDTSSDKDEASGICFINGMDSLTKQLWYLLFPFCIFISTSIYALINLCLKWKYKKEIRFLNFGLNVIMSMFILLVGNIISTMLKIVACSDINGVYVHFYGGDHACFGGIWFFALLSIMIIIIIWIGIYFKIKKMNDIERKSKVSLFRSVTKSYTSEKWYWEFVLLSRRILFAIMVTIQYIDYNFVQYILMSIIVIYFGVHIFYAPFNYHRVNIMETLCLFLSFLVSGLTLVKFHVNHPKLVSVIMSIIVISPFLLLFSYFYLAVTKFLKFKNNPDKLNTTQHQHSVDLWKSRLTPSTMAVYFGDKDHRTATLTQKAIELGSLNSNDKTSICHVATPENTDGTVNDNEGGEEERTNVVTIAGGVTTDNHLDDSVSTLTTSSVP